MPNNFNIPGVYINSNNAGSNTPLVILNAVPIFIGYTERAGDDTVSLLNVPTAIRSWEEYLSLYGGPLKAQFEVSLNAGAWSVQRGVNQTAYLYYSVQLFFANGGNIAYVVSINTYGDQTGMVVQASDFSPSVFALIKNETLPTLLVVPDAAALGLSEGAQVYNAMLQGSAEVPSCFSIFDVPMPTANQSINDAATAYRNSLGTTNLFNAAAYFPWLQATVVQPTDINFEYVSTAINLAACLPEPAAKAVVAQYAAQSALWSRSAVDSTPAVQAAKSAYQSALLAASPTYTQLMATIANALNQLPPSGAMAGIYTLVDASRGVWKAPANVSINLASPLVNVTAEEQEGLNVPLDGKAINCIKTFPGQGTLVWGARTLDANNHDWRYINVRRTIIMIEQSIKQGTQAFAFEPNNATTWIAVKSMIENFLSDLWKQGALAGSTPEQAFDVQVGLGASMTPTDILDGIMSMAVRVSAVHPAEFIEIRIQQSMQPS